MKSIFFKGHIYIYTYVYVYTQINDLEQKKEINIQP